MNKFKVGDRVKVLPGADVSNENAVVGDILTIRESLRGRNEYYTTDGSRWTENELLLIKGGETMGRRTFRLLKETPSVKKGALFQEACEDGTQEYVLLDNNKFLKYEDSRLSHDWSQEKHARDEVEKQPKWFEEVFQPGESWFTKDELDAFKKFVKTQKKK